MDRHLFFQEAFCFFISPFVNCQLSDCCFLLYVRILPVISLFSVFQVTDFVIILNKRSAVEAFSKGGNLTVGGNFTVAAGEFFIFLGITYLIMSGEVF